jgi:hypothetical protein
MPLGGFELAGALALGPEKIVFLARLSLPNTVLLGISKRDDRYLRTLLVHGARLRCERTWRRWRWRTRMRECCGRY